MSEPLRPMTTGELLDRTFALYRRHFVLFVGVSIVGPAMYLLLQVGGAVAGTWTGAAGASADSMGTGFYLATGAATFAGIVAWMFGLALAYAATIRAVSAVHLGQTITIPQAYSSLKGKYGRIFGVFLSVMIRVFGGFFVLVGAAALVSASSVAIGAVLGSAGLVIGSIIAGIAVVAAILLAIALFVRYSLAVQACVVENIRPRDALKRSVFLSKGSRGRILAVYVLFVVLNWVIAGLLLALAAILAAVIGPGLVATFAVYLGNFLAGALASPLGTIALSLVYYDERVRKEAFDLQLMMSALHTPSEGAAATAG